MLIQKRPTATIMKGKLLGVAEGELHVSGCQVSLYQLMQNVISIEFKVLFDPVFKVRELSDNFIMN